MDSDTVMEVCQRYKDVFEFEDDNTEYLLKEAEKLRYRFCCKRQWTIEYNSLLLPGSKYSVKPISMTRILSTLVTEKSWAYSTLTLVLIFIIIVKFSNEQSFARQSIELVMGPVYSILARFRDFVYLSTRK